jgi:hypothetical protein
VDLDTLNRASHRRCVDSPEMPKNAHINAKVLRDMGLGQ